MLVRDPLLRPVASRTTVNQVNAQLQHFTDIDSALLYPPLAVAVSLRMIVVRVMTPTCVQLPSSPFSAPSAQSDALILTNKGLDQAARHRWITRRGKRRRFSSGWPPYMSLRTFESGETNE